MSRLQEAIRQDLENYKEERITTILERFEEIFGYRPKSFEADFDGDVLGSSVFFLKVDGRRFGLMHDEESGREELVTGEHASLGWRYVRRAWTLA